MDPFPQRVYQLVRLIPPGKVATYGQLAFLCGSPRAARMVGAAMFRAPADLPNHRVLYRDGTLCCDQAFGGKEIQREMLAQEGITFTQEGKVNLAVHLWAGPPQSG